MRSGLFYKKISENFGKPGAILTAKAATWVMNPTLPFDGEFITARFKENPAFARAEFGSEWRQDLESFVSLEAVRPASRRVYLNARHNAATDTLRHMIRSAALTTPQPRYRPQGRRHGYSRSDREATSPHDPESVFAEFSDIMRSYRCKRWISDRFGGEWVKSSARRNGIATVEADRSASQAYCDFLPMMNSGQVDLLDNARLVSQLTSLGALCKTRRPR